MVKTWSVDDGLPESGITDVPQSPDGCSWVSTLNTGLSRFDGVRFVNFGSPGKSQFANRGIRRLLKDDEGTLWMNGFGNYVASLRAGELQLEYPGPAVINSLVLAKRDRVIFATKEGQLLERTSRGGADLAWRLIPAPGSGLNRRFFAGEQSGL